MEDHLTTDQLRFTGVPLKQLKQILQRKQILPSGGRQTREIEDFLSPKLPGGGGGVGVLPIMDYTGRLRPKEIPFSGWRYIKG